jgi:hypothetical protein
MDLPSLLMVTDVPSLYFDASIRVSVASAQRGEARKEKR